MKGCRMKDDLSRLGKSVLACLLMGVAACHPVRGNDDAATTTAPKQKQVADSGRMTAGAKFLKALHKLVLDSPVTPEKITAAFGWRVLSQGKEGQIRYTYFNQYPSSSWANSMFTETEDGNTRTSINLSKSSICVNADEILAEFGNNFMPSMKHIEVTSGKNEQSEIVKRNFKLFAYGPIYRFTKPVEYEIQFSYDYSECLRVITVGHPRFK